MFTLFFFCLFYLLTFSTYFYIFCYILPFVFTHLHFLLLSIIHFTFYIVLPFRIFYIAYMFTICTFVLCLPLFHLFCKTTYILTCFLLLYILIYFPLTLLTFLHFVPFPIIYLFICFAPGRRLLLTLGMGMGRGGDHVGPFQDDCRTMLRPF